MNLVDEFRQQSFYSDILIITSDELISKFGIKKDHLAIMLEEFFVLLYELPVSIISFSSGVSDFAAALLKGSASVFVVDRGIMTKNNSDNDDLMFYSIGLNSDCTLYDSSMYDFYRVSILTKHIRLNSKIYNKTHIPLKEEILNEAEGDKDALIKMFLQYNETLLLEPFNLDSKQTVIRIAPDNINTVDGNGYEIVKLTRSAGIEGISIVYDRVLNALYYLDSDTVVKVVPIVEDFFGDTIYTCRYFICNEDGTEVKTSRDELNLTVDTRIIHGLPGDSNLGSNNQIEVAHLDFIYSILACLPQKVYENFIYVPEVSAILNIKHRSEGANRLSQYKIQSIKLNVVNKYGDFTLNVGDNIHKGAFTGYSYMELTNAVSFSVSKLATLSVSHNSYCIDKTYPFPDINNSIVAPEEGIKSACQLLLSGKVAYVFNDLFSKVYYLAGSAKDNFVIVEVSFNDSEKGKGYDISMIELNEWLKSDHKLTSSYITSLAMSINVLMNSHMLKYIETMFKGNMYIIYSNAGEGK